MTTGWIQIGPLSTSRVSIAGCVVDGETKRPLAGVRVAIVDSSRVTATAGDGTFHLADLPGSEYEISFELPGAGLRYGTTTQVVTVEEGGRAVITAELPPTGVKGVVLSPVGGSIYPRAQLAGSGEGIYGGADGSFRLLAVEPGARRILLTAPGCEPRVIDAAITRGEVLDAGAVQLTERSSGS